MPIFDQVEKYRINKVLPIFSSSGRVSIDSNVEKYVGTFRYFCVCITSGSAALHVESARETPRGSLPRGPRYVSMVLRTLNGLFNHSTYSYKQLCAEYTLICDC